MQISSFGQALPAEYGKTGNSQPLKNTDNNNKVENVPQSSKVDMSNVSINEINTLIKSGESALLDILPFIPPDVLRQHDSERVGKVKVDLIGQVETSIEFKKSIGENTTFLEGVLKKIKELDGVNLNGSVNISV